MKVEVIIFDMNKLKIEVEEHIESNQYFKGEFDMIPTLNKHNNFLSLAGIEVNDFKLKVINRDRFIRYIILRYFDGYYIKRTNGIEVGHPDYILEKGNDKIYLELKIGPDGLRTSQLKWFINNKENKNKVIWINWEDDYVEDYNFDGRL